MSLASSPDADLRILGVYPQAQKNRYMLRVKVPGGALSSAQARQLANLSVPDPTPIPIPTRPALAPRARASYRAVTKATGTGEVRFAVSASVFAGSVARLSMTVLRI